MTCIVGLQEDGCVWIGGDSAASRWTDIMIDKHSKVYKKNNMVFGGCGSGRMANLLQYRLSIPEQLPSQSEIEYLNTAFIDAVRACWKQYEVAHVENGITRGSEFLIGYKGKLYGIYSNYDIIESIENYMACGCGGDYALGAMCATGKTGLKPIERVKIALKAAALHSSGVAPPFTIVSIKPA